MEFLFVKTGGGKSLMTGVAKLLGVKAYRENEIRESFSPPHNSFVLLLSSVSVCCWAFLKKKQENNLPFNIPQAVV